MLVVNMPWWQRAAWIVIAFVIGPFYLGWQAVKRLSRRRRKP